MPLTRVTITGADDRTDPKDLLAIMQRYPFVEWGILIGSSTGVRFPSLTWINRFAEAANLADRSANLSLHVCGKRLREIADGRSSLYNELGDDLFRFQRVQLNWHGKPQSPAVANNIIWAFTDLQKASCCRWSPTLIFQLDGVNNELWHDVSMRFACAGLFDISHGAGVLPDDWPKASTEIPCGWAGGLGPENLASEIPKIRSVAIEAVDYWIDMETRVRSQCGTWLDIHKVTRCLEISEPFVAGHCRDPYRTQLL